MLLVLALVLLLVAIGGGVTFGPALYLVAIVALVLLAVELAGRRRVP